MNALPKPRRTPPPVQAISDHALDDLRFIRRTMERASLTAFSGWGQVAIGASALVAAGLAARRHDTSAWLLVWTFEACIAVSIGAVTMALKARRLGVPVFGEPFRRFARSLTLPIVAGAALTVALARAGAPAPIPVTWMLLYGVAIATAGTFSIAAVRVMGYAFMLAGIVAIAMPSAWRDLELAASFGGLHVLFGLWIAGRHGG